VADDDLATRAQAETLLGETDLDLITCVSGEAAVEVLQRWGDDVVRLLTTATLQGEVDGHQLAKAAGRLRPGIRVVVSTGTPDACRERLPEAMCTRQPWLPLDVLVQAYAVFRERRRSVS
jgi:DNA-binding NtrC family response regulator